MPLSRIGTTSPTIACAMVMRPPPPTPVKARNIISCRTVCASEATREPKKKMTKQLKSTVLRDHMSETRPYSSWKEVEVLVKLSNLSNENILADKQEEGSRYPRALATSIQGDTDLEKTSRQGCLVHQCYKINSRTCQKDLNPIISFNDKLTARAHTLPWWSFSWEQNLSVRWRNLQQRVLRLVLHQASSVWLCRRRLLPLPMAMS